MKSSVHIQVFTTIAQYRQWRSSLKDDGSGKPLVGLVPTMGALHRGHVTLIEQARSQCQYVVVSVFVNPLQFGPNEDFDRYPRAFQKDSEICSQAGADAVFHPGVPEFYPGGLAETTKVIPPPRLIGHLCGPLRPGHFEGVCTVVMKLFNAIQPVRAYFGEKDYQQLVVIRQMVSDLNVPIDIVGVATVREPDGLALSSRNVYLQADQRDVAPQLQAALCSIRDRTASGATSLQDALVEARNDLSRIPNLQLQYLEACDAQTLEPVTEVVRPMVILVAAKLGSVRLIDNIIVR